MTQLVGILNLTPDSFSGDGMQSADNALTHVDAMIADGAHIIDIGAESTRPGAPWVSQEEEWRRLHPVLSALGDRLKKVQFSVDTRHASTAQRAITLGVRYINDVSGAHEPDMLAAVCEQDCTLIAMHSVTVPADPRRTIAPEDDPVEVVMQWADTLLARCEKAGIPPARVVIDPGIGFGKTAEQSLLLIKNISRLKALGTPVMIGHSRKSFLSMFTDRKAADRDPETLAISYYLASQGVEYLRVHDVKSHAAMLRIQAVL